MKRFHRLVFAACCLASAWCSHALATPEVWVSQRAVLSQQRAEIGRIYEAQAHDCWQRFVVNACLKEARKVRREALAPIREQELQINERERQWRAEERNTRLEGKQPKNSAVQQLGQP